MALQDIDDGDEMAAQMPRPPPSASLEDEAVRVARRCACRRAVELYYARQRLAPPAEWAAAVAQFGTRLPIAVRWHRSSPIAAARAQRTRANKTLGFVP